MQIYWLMNRWIYYFLPVIFERTILTIHELDMVQLDIINSLQLYCMCIIKKFLYGIKEKKCDY